MLPLSHFGAGSLAYKSRLKYMLHDNLWHRDWTKAEGCRAVATSEAAEETTERDIASCLRSGLVGVTPAVVPRALHSTASLPSGSTIDGLRDRWRGKWGATATAHAERGGILAARGSAQECWLTARSR